VKCKTFSQYRTHQLADRIADDLLWLGCGLSRVLGVLGIAKVSVAQEK